MTELKEQAEVIARALRAGLDPSNETHVEPLPVPQLDLVPSAVLYPGGRGQEFISEGEDENGFSIRVVQWTVLLLGGIPHAAGSYEQLLMFAENLDSALALAGRDPANTFGGHPVMTTVSAPFHIRLGGPEYLGVTADLQHVINRE